MRKHARTHRSDAQICLCSPDACQRCRATGKIFERDIRLYIDGREFNWNWLEQHVRESCVRLRDVTIEVTHPVGDENVLMTRHMLTATACDTGHDWKIEVMDAYELEPNSGSHAHARR